MLSLRCVWSLGEIGRAQVLVEFKFWWSFWETTAKEGEEKGYLPQKVICQLSHLFWGQIAYVVLEEIILIRFLASRIEFL